MVSSGETAAGVAIEERQHLNSGDDQQDAGDSKETEPRGTSAPELRREGLRLPVRPGSARGFYLG